ncbi:hypothetical protein H0H93_013337 [Arthromyces matolae]|nr:hypothetical protein H0H93_013337 [Arthromyces matolae]
MLLRTPVFLFPFTSEHTTLVLNLKKSLQTETTESSSQDVHDLLIALWTCKWIPSDQCPISDPTITCLALMTLNTDSSFKHPSSVTGHIAHFEYIMRFTFLIEMKRRITADPGSSFEEQCENLSFWFVEKNNTTFNSLRSLQHRASSLAYSTISLPKVWWTDSRSYQVLAYEGNSITFSGVKDMFTVIEQDVIDLWERKVLMNLSLHLPYTSLVDDLSNTTVGYSFISDSRNPFMADKDQLMRAVLNDPNLHDRFVSAYDSNGKPVWNIIAFRLWLESYASFHGQLLMRAEMLGGAPARGTELTAMSYKNTPTTFHRSLIAFGTTLAIIVTYHKGSSMTGMDKLIPHALDAVTSDLIIQDLAISRPFAELAVSLCFPGNSSMFQVYNQHLFINNGQLFDTEDLSTLMKDVTARSLRAPLGVRAWRQVCIALRRKHSPVFEQLIEEDNGDTIEALQASHNRWTENRVYGLSSDSLSGVPEDILYDFLKASTHWQITTGAVPGGLCLPYFQARTSFFQDLVKAGTIIIPSSPSQALPQINIPELVAALGPSLTDLLKSVVDEAIKEKIVPLLLSGQSLSLPSPSPLSYPVMLPSSPPQPSVNIPDPESPLVKLPSPQTLSSVNVPDLDIQALSALRKVLGRSDANWSSPQQREAVLSVLRMEGDVCAFLATGAGKTMLAIIPTIVQPTTISIVVLPLKAIILDYERKLQALKIPFELYTGNPDVPITGKHNLILVSTDRARQPNFQQSVLQINSKRSITRVFFDECHYPLVNNGFRVCLEDVDQFRILGVQLILLSATVPPSSRPALMDCFKLVRPAVITMPTDRPELQYIIKPPSPKTATLIDSVVAFTQEQMLFFEPQDRALIFVSFKEHEGQPISQALGCDFYHGGPELTDEERRACYYRWVQGTHRVLVCTNAFSAGNDYPHVRFVVHAGTPREMIGYIQEVGRAGRDGSHSLCVLFPRKAYPPSDIIQPDHSGRQAAWNMSLNPPPCIRFFITKFNDGAGIDCASSRLGYKCSSCQELTALNPVVSTPQSVPPNPSVPVESALSNPPTLLQQEASALFQQQADASHEKKMTAFADKAALINHFKAMLSRFANLCALCFSFGQQATKHNIMHCPLLQTLLSGQGEDHYKQLRGLIKYTRHPQTRVCFTCHIPQISDSLHPTFGKSATSCTPSQKDIILPIAFSIFHQAHLKAAAQTHFSVTWNTLDSFVQWLIVQSPPHHLTNASSLFLWYSGKIDLSGSFIL